MENYIVLNGITYDLVERTQSTQPEKKDTKLSEISVGELCKLGAYDLIVLEQSSDTTAVILKDLLIEKKQFGQNNNYDGSYVDEECRKFAGEIAAIVGEDNLVEHTIDLTSDDGLKNYGKIRRKASLMTTELYRRYVYILDKHSVKKWWWLATPWSTPTHNDSTLAKCVSPDGRINGINCDYDSGVRPFCILKSHIFVSR